MVDVLKCVLPLAMLFGAAYPLARALGLPWRTRLLTTATLGLAGGPALAWATGVLVPAVRPDLPLMLLGLVGAVLLVRDLQTGDRPRLRPDRDLLLVLGAMLLVTAVQCSVLVGTHWQDGGLVIVNLFPHDALWHLAISAMLRPGEQFATPWPPINPVWPEARLTNYHPLTDVLVALLAPHEGHIAAYFHVLPPLYCLLFTGGAAWVARQWGASYRQAAFTVVLAGLCGSLGHLVAVVNEGGPDLWDSAFWLSQPWSMCNNPPMALSFSALLVGLAVLSLRQAPLAARAGVLCLLWGTSFGIKAYMPVLLLPSLALAVLLGEARERRELALLWGAAVAGAVAMFLLTTRGAVGHMVYSPGWLLWTLLGQTDRLGGLTNRTLTALPPDLRGAGIFGWLLLGLPLFIVGNLGVRIVGLRPAWRAFTGRAEVAPGTRAAQRTALSVSALGLLLPVLFKQRGVEWNSIQFAYYALVLSAIWAAPRLYDWIRTARPAWKAAARGLLVALLTLPTPIQMMTLERRPTLVRAEEVAGMRELKRRVPVGGTVAIRPSPASNDPVFHDGQEYDTTDPTGTALVAALSARPTYYADQLTLDILLLPGKQRREELEAALSLPEPERQRWLQERGIRAVYPE